jgi:hypothetical protein
MMSLEAPLIHRAASSLIRDAAAPIAAIGSIASMNIGSYVNTDGKNLCKAVLTSDKNAEAGGFKIFPDLRIDKTIVDGKPVFKTINGLYMKKYRHKPL